MTTETEPHLRAVPEDPEATTEAAPAPSDAKAPPEAKAPLWAWVAVAALVFCAVGWYTSHQGGVELRGELMATQAALAEAEADLGAHQAHLDQVRTQSAALATSLGGLAAEAEALSSKAAEAPVR